jgi:DNA-directed RNA polymerase specialized sigma subunit
MTQTEIAAALKISPARLSQIVTELRRRAESIVRA